MMNRLIRAQTRRMFSDKIFFACVAAMLITSCLLMLNIGYHNSASAEYPLENYFFNFMPFLTVFHAVFIGLFIGTENSDGTIRNKIIAGHSRRNIYLTNTAVCCVASIVFTVTMLVSTFITGIFFFGMFKMDIFTLFIYLGIVLLSNLSLSVIFTLINMLCTNKALASVCTILVFFAFLVVASSIYNMLLEPEILNGMAFINGEMKMMEPSPNPYYVSGSARIALENALDFLPTGQFIQIADLAIVNPLRIFVFNILLICSTCAAGIFAFSKKDLK